MKSTSGAGVLVAHGRQIHILYDLVQPDEPKGGPVVGQIFGDAEALHDAFCTARWPGAGSSGRTASIVLENCESRGAADVKIVGPMHWD